MNEYMIYRREGSVWQRFWSARQDQLSHYLNALRDQHGDVAVLFVPHQKEFRHPTVLGDDGLKAHLEHLSAMTLQPV